LIDALPLKYFTNNRTMNEINFHLLFFLYLLFYYPRLYLIDISHVKISLSIRDSFIDEFKLHKMRIKLHMHIRTKISMDIGIFSDA